MRLINYILIILIIYSFLINIYRNGRYFTRPFDPVYFGKLYSESQYVKGQLSKGGIGDDGLYAFAGYYYLFQKGDISSVNFEHPPLGKYLIGLSILFFNNENIINLIYLFLLIIIVYKFGVLILKNHILSLLGVLIIVTDPLILDNTIRSLLDLPFTLFFVSAVYFFLRSRKNIRLLYISQFFWALAFATRFFPSFLILYIFLLSVIIISRKQDLKTFLLSSFIIPLIYLIVHASFFYYHRSFIEFIRHKIWMISWFRGSVVTIGNIWRNIFTGYYYDTSGLLRRNEYWLPLIPVLVILSVFRIIIRKKDSDITYLYFFTVIYLVYVTFLTDGLQKFIMPIYPIIIILALSSISCIINTCRKVNIRKLREK